MSIPRMGQQGTRVRTPAAVMYGEQMTARWVAMPMTGNVLLVIRLQLDVVALDPEWD